MTKARIREEGTTTGDANAALGKALNEWFTTHGPDAIFKSCGNCKHMAQAGPAFCGLYNTTPPVAVIIAGCPSHDDMEVIPF